MKWTKVSRKTAVHTAAVYLLCMIIALMFPFPYWFIVFCVLAIAFYSILAFRATE